MNGWHSQQMGPSTENEKKSKLFNSRAWGLPSTEIRKLAQRLYEFWERYADCFETTTRDTGHYALIFLSGLLLSTGQKFDNFPHSPEAAPTTHDLLLEIGSDA